MNTVSSQDFFGTPNATSQPTQSNQSVSSQDFFGGDKNTPDTKNTYGAWFPASQNDTDTPVMAGLKSLGNVVPSLTNLVGGVANAVAHPIDTGTGILHAGAGAVETGLNKTFGTNVSDVNTRTFDALSSALKGRYGSLDNLRKTAVNDPVGFGADVMSIIEGGAGLADKIAGTTGVDIANDVSKGRLIPPEMQTGINATPVGEGTTVGKLNSAISTIGRPVVDVVKGTASLPIKLVGQTLGLGTGVGYDPIKQGLLSASQGGDAMKSFTETLRGKTSPEDLVNQARNALGQVVDQRSQSYKDMLSTLGMDKTTYDISPIYREAENQLQKFGITKTTDGSLDFSRSKFALDSTAQNDVSRVYDYVKSYGLKAGDRTALGVDNLKQILAGYYSPNSDYRAFIEGLRKTTRNVLDNAPGYTEEMKKYSEMTDNIKDIKQSLSLGDKAMVETSFKKLASALKNNEFRQQVIQELDNDTGGQLLSGIAGQRLNSIVPRGLAGVLEGGIGGLTAVMHPGGILPLLGMAITTSPRVVGEFVRGLGLGIQATDKLMSILDKFSTPVAKNSGLRNFLEPADQTTDIPNE